MPPLLGFGGTCYGTRQAAAHRRKQRTRNLPLQLIDRSIN
jgi:hypothetical protein